MAAGFDVFGARNEVSTERMLASLLFWASLLVVPLDVAVVAGRIPPGVWVEIEPIDAAQQAVTLCQPECALSLNRGRYKIGFRDGADSVSNVTSVVLDHDVQLAVRPEDRSLFRGLGHGLLVSTAILLVATAVVGIATEPDGPTTDWRGEQHGLLFAGIATGIVLTLGLSGTVLSLEFERDSLTLEVTPIR